MKRLFCILSILFVFMPLLTAVDQLEIRVDNRLDGQVDKQKSCTQHVVTLFEQLAGEKRNLLVVNPLTGIMRRVKSSSSIKLDIPQSSGQQVRIFQLEISDLGVMQLEVAFNYDGKKGNTAFRIITPLAEQGKPSFEKIIERPWQPLFKYVRKAAGSSSDVLSALNQLALASSGIPSYSSPSEPKYKWVWDPIKSECKAVYTKDGCTYHIRIKTSDYIEIGFGYSAEDFEDVKMCA